MNVAGTKRMKTVLSAAVVAMGFAASVGAQVTASIHGHVNDELGTPIKLAEVRLTQNIAVDADKRTYQYVFKVDASGNYTGTGISTGKYTVVLFADDKSLDFLTDQDFKAGVDTLDNFDLSRAEYIAKATPERKKEIEEFRKKNADVMNANKVVGNLNATLNAVRADLATPKPNFADDEQKMNAAIQAKPDEAILYFQQGAVEYADAESMAADLRAQHKPVQSDDATMGKYQQTVDTYKKGIELNDAAMAAKKKASPADSAVAWNSIGNSEAKLGKITEAQAAFDSAVKLNPAGAGMYYANAAAVLFNAGQSAAAGEAAQKAIAADPTKADPYFVLGQALIQKATVDKSGKVVAPPGTVEAYQKYLELAPDGKNADTVKEILTSLGEKINTKYKAGKK